MPGGLKFWGVFPLPSPPLYRALLAPLPHFPFRFPPRPRPPALRGDVTARPGKGARAPRGDVIAPAPRADALGRGGGDGGTAGPGRAGAVGQGAGDRRQLRHRRPRVAVAAAEPLQQILGDDQPGHALHLPRSRAGRRQRPRGALAPLRAPRPRPAVAQGALRDPETPLGGPQNPRGTPKPPRGGPQNPPGIRGDPKTPPGDPKIQN